MAAIKKDFNFNAVMYAAAGGAASALVQEGVEMIPGAEKYPQLAALAPAAIGAAGAFFMPQEQYKPLFYGMIGAAANDFMQDMLTERANKPKSKAMELPQQGFSRVNLNGNLEDLKEALEMDDTALMQELLDEDAGEE